MHEVQSQWANQSCKIFVLNDIVCIDRHVECLKVMEKKYDLCLVPVHRCVLTVTMCRKDSVS